MSDALDGIVREDEVCFLLDFYFIFNSVLFCLVRFGFFFLSFFWLVVVVGGRGHVEGR